MTTSGIKYSNAAVLQIEEERLQAGIAAMVKLSGLIRGINVSYEAFLEEKIEKLYPQPPVNTETPSGQAVPIEELQYAVK